MQITKHNNTAFEIEKLRASLAHKKMFRELAKTYNKKYPEINNKNTIKLWDKLNMGNHTVDNPMSRDRLEIINNRIKNFNGNILNIGFGSASLEKRVFAKYNNFNNISWKGIDISKLSVREAQRNFPFAEFRQGYAEKLPFKSNYFELVIALEVLEHISPPKTFQVLKEIYRVMKRGEKV